MLLPDIDPETYWRTHLAGMLRAATQVGRRRIWLVSYPRSGSTLMREYLSILQGRPQLSIYPNDVVKPSGPRLTGALDGVVIVKSHQLPADDGNPMIYLVRDGRNATLSFLYMSFLFGGHQYSRMEDAYAGIRFLDRTEGSWAAHVRAALAQAERRPLLILHHENLVTEPAETLLRLAAFLDATLTQATAEVCVEQQRASTTYRTQRGSGYLFEPEPGSLFAVLKQHRQHDYWRLILDARCKRHLHRSGATPFLLRFGYERSSDWWRDGAVSGM